MILAFPLGWVPSIRKVYRRAGYVYWCLWDLGQKLFVCQRRRAYAAMCFFFFFSFSPVPRLRAVRFHEIMRD